MKRKNKRGLNRSTAVVSPEEAVQFLEDFRRLSGEINEATVPISIRVPANLLRALKTRAKLEKRKYQSLMIDLLRSSL